MDFRSCVDVLHQNKKFSFGPMFSDSSESLNAFDREAVVWTKKSLLNSAYIYVVCFRKVCSWSLYSALYQLRVQGQRRQSLGVGPFKAGGPAPSLSGYP